MLIPCVNCGDRFYTEESPLWFHCDKCLKSFQKQREKNIRKTWEELYGDSYSHCESCGYRFPNHHIYLSSDGGEYCRPCIESFSRGLEYEEAE